MNIRMRSAARKWVKSRLSLPMSGLLPSHYNSAPRKPLTSPQGRVRRENEVNVQCPRDLEDSPRPACLFAHKELERTATQQSGEGTSAADLAEYERRCRTEASPQEGRREEEWSIISVAQDFHNVA